MLTLQKLRTYRKFRGDIDGYGRSHVRGDRSGITEEDFQLIAELLTALYIIASGKASQDFALGVERKLSELAPEPQTRQELRQLANSKL